MNLAILLLQVVLFTLMQVQSVEKCTERYTLIPGPTPRDGRDGIQGVAGKTGDKGDQGNIGPPGHKGDKGNIGATGPKGDRGNIGSNGTKGDRGSIGQAGSKGDKGNIGATGPKGNRGNIGSNGTKGDRGNIGQAGSKGDRGNIGATGPKGDKGNIGATGPKGDRGNIGQAGLKGDKGNIGATGPKGDKGNIGATGPKGDKGNIGATGLKGDRGNIGATGLKGDRGNIGATGPKGDKGNIGATGSKGDKGNIGATGSKGDRGNIGATGTKGDKGNVGATGPKGNPGSVTVTGDDFQTLNETLTDRIRFLESQVLVITSVNWRRVAYFDTTKGNSCPTGLRTVTNTTTRQTACGRTANGGCTSLQFSPSGSYTNVRGRMRGYQYGRPEVFSTGTTSIDSHYLHGVSITHGTPRTHLWSYVTSYSEQYSTTTYRCPCARPDPTDRTYVPSFVGEHFYCESGFSGNQPENRIAWEDPLWDGLGCFASGNQCCNRYGWFHREIPATSDNIEVRWCANIGYTDEDVLTDQLEIWVM